MFEGQEIKEGTPSRRDFLLGIVVTSAVALPMFSPPARAAVSMLHTGLDPKLVESPERNNPGGKSVAAVEVMGADMAAEGMGEVEVMATVGMAVGIGTVIVAEAGMAAEVGMAADVGMAASGMVADGAMAGDVPELAV